MGDNINMYVQSLELYNMLAKIVICGVGVRRVGRNKKIGSVVCLVIKPWRCMSCGWEGFSTVKCLFSVCAFFWFFFLFSFFSWVENGWFLNWFFFDPFSSRVCLLIFTMRVCSFFQFKPREVCVWCVLDVSVKLSLQWVFVKCWRERSQPNKKLTFPHCSMAYIILPRPIPS